MECELSIGPGVRGPICSPQDICGKKRKKEKKAGKKKGPPVQWP
jgi:hypothetical protein